MNEPEFQMTPLSALETSGAVCARMIHDLSNLISGIVGNADYAQNATNNPEGVQKALQAIRLSANSAGKLLGQCLPLQRSISSEAFPYDVREQACRIAEAGGVMPGWQVMEPAELAGQARVQPRWLSAAVWQIVRETQVMRGEVEFASGPAVFPVVWRSSQLGMGQPSHLFQIALRYRSDQPLFAGKDTLTLERPGLLAACELISRFRGQIQLLPKSPGRQEIYILIPLE